MKKLMLLIAAGSLWLFLAAVPALADGGVHTVAQNSGAATLTSDSCAGCHRAHSAKGEYLIKSVTEEALCLNCHDSAGAGASTDVESGVQYAIAAGIRNEFTTIGALRGGGFLHTQMGDAARLQVATTNKTKVPASIGADAATTSAHIELTGATFALPHILWGNGADGSGVGPSVSLECTNCHNPHGNGQYRILNPIPVPTGTSGAVAEAVAQSEAVNKSLILKLANPFAVGDVVDVSGTGYTDGTYVVLAVSGLKVQLATQATWATSGTNASAVIPSNGTGGTLTRASASVTDSPVVNPANSTIETKNYTIIQKQGAQGDPTSYLLYASQVTGTYAPTTGDYWHRQVPWNGNAPAGRVASITGTGPFTVTTVSAHLFQVGELAAFTMNATDSTNSRRCNATVATVPTATTFTVASCVIGGSTTSWTMAAGTWSTSATAYPSVAQGIYADTAKSTLTAGSVITGVTTGTFTTSSYAGLVAGDIVTMAKITGLTDGANYVVASATSSAPYTFTLTTGSPTALGSAPLVTKVWSQNDAPNGQPATSPKAALSAVAWQDQMTGWCAACHTRYLSLSNVNPAVHDLQADAEPSSSSAPAAKTVTSLTVGTGTFTVYNHGYKIGDSVTFSGTSTDAPATITGPYYVRSVTDHTFTVSTTPGGAASTWTGTATVGNVILTTVSGENAGIKGMGGVDGTTDRISGFLVGGTTGKSSDPAYATGDIVKFVTLTGMTGLDTSTNYYVVNPVAAVSYAAGPPVVDAAAGTFQVSLTIGGAAIDFSGTSTGTVAIRLIGPASASSWFYPRATDAGTDSIYMYQHRSTSNRVCTICHVAHGTSASMTGYAQTEGWPGTPDTIPGATSPTSRLLKMDNRGTCMACHDPTSTWTLAYPDKFTGDTHALAEVITGTSPATGYPLYYPITNQGTQLVVP